MNEIRPTPSIAMYTHLHRLIPDVQNAVREVGGTVVSVDDHENRRFSFLLRDRDGKDTGWGWAIRISDVCQTGNQHPDENYRRSIRELLNGESSRQIMALWLSGKMTLEAAVKSAERAKATTDKIAEDALLDNYLANTSEEARQERRKGKTANFERSYGKKEPESHDWMFHLYGGGNLPVSTICEMLNIDPSSITAPDQWSNISEARLKEMVDETVERMQAPLTRIPMTGFTILKKT